MANPVISCYLDFRMKEKTQKRDFSATIFKFFFFVNIVSLYFPFQWLPNSWVYFERCRRRVYNLRSTCVAAEWIALHRVLRGFYHVTPRPVINKTNCRLGFFVTRTRPTRILTCHFSIIIIIIIVELKVVLMLQPDY